MKNYLSFGGGVNSVAMYLMLMDQGVEFEAVFVDHGCDWPETYEYVEMFKEKYPLTVLKPKDGDLYSYAWEHEMFPHRKIRWCTSMFKRAIFNRYAEKPCFVFIGYDFGERNRIKIYSEGGREYRWPLVEAEIDRNGCKKIITDHRMPVQIKSGCYICPFQRVGQLRELRKIHPKLFCKMERLENRNNKYRAAKGLKPYYSFKKPVREIAEKNIYQIQLWPEDEYPPCECGL